LRFGITLSAILVILKKIILSAVLLYGLDLVAQSKMSAADIYAPFLLKGRKKNQRRLRDSGKSIPYKELYFNYI